MPERCFTWLAVLLFWNMASCERQHRWKKSNILPNAAQDRYRLDDFAVLYFRSRPLPFPSWYFGDYWCEGFVLGLALGFVLGLALGFVLGLGLGFVLGLGLIGTFLVAPGSLVILSINCLLPPWSNSRKQSNNITYHRTQFFEFHTRGLELWMLLFFELSFTWLICNSIRCIDLDFYCPA